MKKIWVIEPTGVKLHKIGSFKYGDCVEVPDIVAEQLANSSSYSSIDPNKPSKKTIKKVKYSEE